MIPEISEIALTRSYHYEKTVWHSHRTMQIGYLLEGSKTIYFREGSFKLKPNDTYIIAPGHVHMIEEEPDSIEYHGFALLSSTPSYFSYNAAAIAGFSWLNLCSVIYSKQNFAEGIYKKILKYWEKATPKDKLLSQCEFIKLLAELETMDCQKIYCVHKNSISFTEDNLFNEAIRNIELLYRNVDLKVDEIAERCGVSRSSLDKSFHKNFGIGPKEYLQRYRIGKTTELFRDRDKSMSQIAKEIGFPDVYTFSRIFRRVKGISPTKARGV